MNNYLLSTLLVLSGVAGAASLPPEDIPPSLRENLIYALSIKSEAPIIKKVDFQINCGDVKAVQMGKNHPYKGHIVWNIEQHAPMKGNSYTVSFDLINLESNVGGTLIAFHSLGTQGTEGIHLRYAERGRIVLSCNKHAGSAANESEHQIMLGRKEDVLGKTITIIHNGNEKTVRIFLDGIEKGPAIQLPYPPGYKENHQLSLIALADNYQGWHHVDSFGFDNLYCWNKALTQDEVSDTIKKTVKRIKLKKGKKKKKRKKKNSPGR